MVLCVFSVGLLVYGFVWRSSQSRWTVGETVSAPGQGGSHATKSNLDDSASFVNASWTVDSIEGTVLKRLVLRAGQHRLAPQRVFVLEVPKDAPYRFSFSYEPVRTVVSKHADRHGAFAAINGSFFDMDKHNPICFLRIDGVQLGENTPGVDTINRKYYQYGCLVLREGRPVLLHTDSSRVWEQSLPDSNVMTAGPLLMLDGRAFPMRNDRTFVTQRHNRTALGIRADGTVLLVVVDGRMRESAGLSLTELIDVMRWLGCRDAINLDGGGSTTMYMQGQPWQGVLNYPTDNGRFDHLGQRGVSNCVLLQKVQ